MFYIDKGNAAFRQSRNSEYIDKSGLIAVVNKTLFTEQSFTCVTRCRRFGKSMTPPCEATPPPWHAWCRTRTSTTHLIKYSDERSTFGRSATAENSMSCVLSIAYYYAHGDYIFHREYQTGTGFADLVLMPRKNTSTPAIIVELKYNDTVDTAIDQIHHGIYDLPIYDLLFDRNGAAPIVNSKFVNSKYNDILLVAVSFDRKTKVHDCRIETWHKES